MMNSMKSGETVKAVIHYRRAKMIVAGEENKQHELNLEAISGIKFLTTIFDGEKGTILLFK